LENTKIIILGAGYSGLATAAILARLGHDVCVLESHSLPGGCASFFQRGPYRFDVGATTLSGMAFHGPLKILYDQLDLKTPLIKQDIGMEIHFDQHKLKRYAHHEQWMDQLKTAFPRLDCRPSWNRFQRWNELSWMTLPRLSSFPAQNANDFLRLIPQAGLKGISLLPALMQTVFSSLSPAEKGDQNYKKFLDEQLLISTQSMSHQVNALVGSLGLIYPSDTYYPVGGMAALAQELVTVIKENGGKIIYKQEVTQIKKVGKDFIITTSKDRQFKSQYLLSSIPGWNHLKIGPVELKPEMEQFNQRYPKAWGAMVGYFAVRLKKQPDCQYFQIHTTHQHPRLKEMKSLFFSLSHPTDQSRAPQGFQTVTVSTHCLDGQDLSRESVEYEELKMIFKEHICDIFKQHFQDYIIEEINTPEIATPLSFEHYTKRLHGRVGGLAHGSLWDLLCYPGQETQVPNFYRLGDTVFPGQGVVGVVAGAQKLVAKLERRGLQ
jgi:C-3',4' desaturase CrtD